jgi:trans-2,3-dihydro-3-hydroxyanthranilate isomerase
MPRRFVTLDVFTDTPLAGNPLAVVLDAEELSDGQMQAIAREFNLSETVFIRPPGDAERRADMRIFTPARELPFAGHPTVGAAVLLALRDGLMASERFALGEAIGPVECQVIAMGEGVGQVRFRLPRLPQSIGQPADDASLAAALGLDPGEIGFEGHRPSVMSAGVGFTFIPVSGRDALARAWPIMPRWGAIQPRDHANAFVYCREPGNPDHHFRARMFAPDMGIMEDPATGGAVAAFAGVVMACDRPADGVHRLMIGQGYERGRPSDIELTLEVRGGAFAAAHIGGAAVIISEGKLLF